MTITNTSTRLAALVAGVAVAIALMGAVAVAPAQAAGLSATQVQAIVSLLASFGADQATINNVTAALNGQATSGTGSTGSTGGACPVLTRSLQLGSSGADVMSLQKFLNASAATRVAVSGAGSPGMETTYFGPATQAAVIKFQAANNVSAIGVVGPATRAAIAAVCGGTGTGTGTGTGGSTTLQGGEGQLTNIDNISTDVEDEVDEDGEEYVFGLELDAEDSDVMIERVDVDFTAGDANDSGDSDNLDDYVTEVSIVLDGKVLATLDADEAEVNDAGDGDFTTAADGNDVYSFRFTGLKGVIKEDDTADLYVRVTAVGNVDSGETNADWYVLIPDDGIRAVDAAGISDTYVDAADLDEETFSVVEPDAGDLDLSAAEADNEDRTINVDADADTNGEEVMVFTLESNTSDNNVTDINIEFATTTATTTAFTDVISQVHLYKGSTLLGSEDIAATSTGGGTVTFDDLDVDIEEDEEVEFTVKVDFNDEADEREGFTFYAYVDASDLEAEDSEGDNVTVTGDEAGGTIELRTEGITVAFVSASEAKTFSGDATGEADIGEFKITVDITANGEDVYVDKSITADPDRDGSDSAGDGFLYATTSESTTGTTTSAAVSQVSGSTSGDTSAHYIIEDGDTERFTITVTVTAGTDGFSAIQLTGINWDTDTTINNFYNFDMDDYKTDLTSLNYVN